MAQRFTVTYRIFAADLVEAEQRAAGIALEQTVEIPRDVVPAGYIEDVILGKVEQLREEGQGRFVAKISYSPDAAGAEFPQLLNVIFGNSSIQKGLKVIGLELCDTLRNQYPGARFGIAGIRRLTGRTSQGLVCPVIKPQGSSSERLAELCYLTARAGADIIKEDHGLGNQPNAPFEQRVTLCAQAVQRANQERREEGDDTQALYFATLGGHSDELLKQAMFAKRAGVDGVILMPGLIGFDAINRLARNAEFGLPIMAHPSHLGPYILSDDTGYSHAMMFGTLMQMVGADISIFPNVGGRFGFSAEECKSIATTCQTAEIGRAILPSPGGGMTIDRMGDMMKMYGPDCVYLLGGGLLRYGDKIGHGIREMRLALDRGAA